MRPKLVAYQYVPSGFEMIIAEEEVKTWNLWWNVKQTDDPEAWDEEIRFINKMQDGLGALTLDQRLIRAQMAEFCRLHPLFPRSIDILCEEIGEGRFSKPVKIGYEGRGLLDSLGYHDDQSLDEQRKNIFTTYARSLKKWIGQGRPENPTESKVFGFLGQPTSSKKTFVEALVSVIDSEEISIFSLMSLSENECRKAHGKWIFDTFAHPVRCFSCEEADPGRAAIPDGQCHYSMILDAGILCSGTFGEQRSTFEEYRCFTQENILAYSVPINSWLREEPPKPATLPKDARYVTEDDASEIAGRVHSSLGERDETKEWLTACLLKTIKDNQRWEERAELIDNYPETTSWFREILLRPTGRSEL